MSKQVPYHKKPLGQIRADAKKIFDNPYRYAPEEMSPNQAMSGKGDYIGGKHYNRLPDHFQPAEVSHAWGLDFLLWNTVKYLSRAGHKEDMGMSAVEKEIDDLKKAIDYIRMRINVLKGRTPLDFGQAEQVDWLDEPIESFMERWNPETMAEANAKYAKQKEAENLGEVDDDGIPL